MSCLLDAARRLAEYPPSYDSRGHMLCGYCHEDEHVHAPDCPWLSLPKIVAALEAAEWMVKAHESHEYPGYWGAMQRGVRMYREVAPKDEHLTGTTS